MRRALLSACGALALAAAAWGCATSGASSPAPQQAKAEHDWQHYEPDGGWAAYRPESREFDVNPAESSIAVSKPSALGLPSSTTH